MHGVDGKTDEETNVDRGDRPSRVDLDVTGSRKRRVTVLRDLVDQRAYEVRSEDVAASIIRDALVVSPPVGQRRQ
jgi:hypothetical protein